VTSEGIRQLPAGAEALSDGVHFRVWAPDHKSVDVVFDGDSIRPCSLKPDADGYFSVFAPGIRAGACYKYRLDGDQAFPDPASRFQPKGVHDSSQVVDASRFEWTDRGWLGVTPERQIIYELHVGTFTPEGTWEAAATKLDWLRDTGMTVIEVMPVSEFPGRFGWGYDGVHWFAPTHLYGEPDDFRAFVDLAHALGLGVILDVVYNHLGPDGNYLGRFSKYYFNRKHQTDWGSGINYDGEHSGPVRDFTVSNAEYWIREFHLDGLRLDATQNIEDDSPEHILKVVACRARAAASGRSIILVAENEPQHTRLVRRPEDGGYGLDMLWNDDFHHSATVAMTGRNEAYYSDYLGTPQEFISAAKYGYLFQGQWYVWQDGRRGTPSLDLPPHAFVNFTENHDQIANSVSARRLVHLTDPGTYKAVTATMLLLPGNPMLFQGQEFGATSPFHYFADHNPKLAQTVAKGRRDFMLQFQTVASPEAWDCLPDPADRATFESCKLDWRESEQNGELVAFHRDLIRLRREDPTLAAPPPRSIDGAIVASEAFLLRYFGSIPGEDRLLIVNLGRDLLLSPAPQPLLAPPFEMQWDRMWASEDPCYGGCGTPEIDTTGPWRVSARTAVLFKPGPRTRPSSGGHPLEKEVRSRNKQLVAGREQSSGSGGNHG
jgi:maltooligosyltrehalose trehalohydrolase